MDDIIKMASKLPLFSELSGDELGEMISLTKESEFEKGQIIFSEGDAGDEMFILTEGVVEITARIGDAVEKTLLTLRSSGVFGELALISGLPRSGTAKALEKSRLLEISAESFRKLCANMPSTGIKLQSHLLNIISERLRNTTDLYRRAAEWGLNISGIIQLDYNRLIAESQQINIDLANGKSVSGTLLKVEKHENGIMEFYIRTGPNSFSIVPYHSIARMGFQDKTSSDAKTEGGN